MKEISNMDMAVNFVEIEYIEQMKKQLSLGELDDLELHDRLFPYEWYDMDSETKMHALKEALDKNILLEDTEYVNKYFNVISDEKSRFLQSMIMRFICGDDD